MAANSNTTRARRRDLAESAHLLAQLAELSFQGRRSPLGSDTPLSLFVGLADRAHFVAGSVGAVAALGIAKPC